MTGRDGLSDARSRSRALAPGCPPTGSRLRSFAINDLLGLEADLPTPAEPRLRSNCEAPAEATEPRPGPGPGLCGSCPARGALPLGLGLLCGFGAQPPSAAAARARCLLLADLRLLPPAGPEPAVAQSPVHPPPALGSQQRSESVSTSGNLVNASRLQSSKGQATGLGLRELSPDRPLHLLPVSKPQPPKPHSRKWGQPPKVSMDLVSRAADLFLSALSTSFGWRIIGRTGVHVSCPEGRVARTDW